jgi:hypothetical protein
MMLALAPRAELQAQRARCLTQATGTAPTLVTDSMFGLLFYP